MPMRSALMPPDAEDEEPQIVIDRMMTKSAPEPMAKRIWPPWSVEKPRLKPPESTSNKPRRTTPPVVVKYEPARAKAHEHREQRNPDEDRANLDVLEEVAEYALPYVTVEHEVNAPKGGKHESANLERPAMERDDARSAARHASRSRRRPPSRESR